MCAAARPDLEAPSYEGEAPRRGLNGNPMGFALSAPGFRILLVNSDSREPTGDEFAGLRNSAL